MRPPRPLVIVGLITLAAMSIALALLASIVRATPAAVAPAHSFPAFEPPTPAAPPLLTATPSAAGGLPSGAAPFALEMQASSGVVTPGGTVRFQLTVRAGSAAAIETRSFLSGPADVAGVQASGGICAAGNPVVCRWALGDHAGTATIVARVAPQAAAGTAISMQALAQDSQQYSTASNASVALVQAVNAVRIGAGAMAQAASATPGAATTDEGAPAAMPGHAPRPAATPIATAPPTETPSRQVGTTPDIPTPERLPDIIATIGKLPETAALPSAPVLALAVLGCAIIVVGVRRIYAADLEVRVQSQNTRGLAAIISAIGYLQRRTRVEAETMDANSQALSQHLEERRRRSHPEA